MALKDVIDKIAEENTFSKKQLKQELTFEGKIRIEYSKFNEAELYRKAHKAELYRKINEERKAYYSEFLAHFFEFDFWLYALRWEAYEDAINDMANAKKIFEKTKDEIEGLQLAILGLQILMKDYLVSQQQKIDVDGLDYEVFGKKSQNL